MSHLTGALVRLLSDVLVLTLLALLELGRLQRLLADALAPRRRS